MATFITAFQSVINDRPIKPIRVIKYIYFVIILIVYNAVQVLAIIEFGVVDHQLLRVVRHNNTGMS